MKKLMSLLLAALFAVSLSVATFAEDKPAPEKKQAKHSEGKKHSKKKSAEVKKEETK